MPQAVLLSASVRVRTNQWSENHTCSGSNDAGSARMPSTSTNNSCSAEWRGGDANPKSDGSVKSVKPDALSMPMVAHHKAKWMPPTTTTVLSFDFMIVCERGLDHMAWQRVGKGA